MSSAANIQAAADQLRESIASGASAMAKAAKPDQPPDGWDRFWQLANSGLFFHGGRVRIPDRCSAHHGVHARGVRPLILNARGGYHVVVGMDQSRSMSATQLDRRSRSPWWGMGALVASVLLTGCGRWVLQLRAGKTENQSIPCRG